VAIFFAVLPITVDNARNYCALSYTDTYNTFYLYIIVAMQKYRLVHLILRIQLLPSKCVPRNASVPRATVMGFNKHKNLVTVILIILMTLLFLPSRCA
jgi:uncharacterized protein YqhQ